MAKFRALIEVSPQFLGMSNECAVQERGWCLHVVRATHVLSCTGMSCTGDVLVQMNCTDAELQRCELNRC